jgi:hypothetical protein
MFFFPVSWTDVNRFGAIEPFEYGRESVARLFEVDEETS